MRSIPVRRMSLALVLTLAGLASAGDTHKRVDPAVITLEPFQERLELGDTARFVGTLQEGYRYAFCAVTRPGGSVVYIRSAKVEGSKVTVTVPLDAGHGRYQVEYVVSGEYGNQVAANIDVFAGESTETPQLPSDDFDERSPPRALARELFDLTNAMRAEQGQAQLTWDPTLADIASEHAEACARANRLAHVLPEDGGSVADRAARKFGWTVRYGLPGHSANPRKGGPILIGDNLAVCANPKLALFLLSESPGHRAAMLNPHVDLLGIGAVRDVERRDSGTQVGIYFCMVFAQINDTNVAHRLQEDRQLEDVSSHPGGGILGSARAYEKSGKTLKAVEAYRRFLARHGDSPVAEEVRNRVDRLISTADTDLEAQLQARRERRSSGLLQQARNYQLNNRTEKAVEKLRQVIEESPGGEAAAEAARLLAELGG